MIDEHGTNGTALAEVTQQQFADTLELFQERIAELELTLEDGSGWWRLDWQNRREFSRDGLNRIIALSRLFFLKNPLINRPVTLQAFYVWGQGVQISGHNDAINGVIQRFLDDPKNQAELTGHQARADKEIELQVTGNLFLVFFTNTRTGRVRVRSIPADEVADIITNPDDAKEPWYYKRTWTVQGFDPGAGGTLNEIRTAYYPDWRYQPPTRIAAIDGQPVHWDTPVYHRKVGGLPDMRFGLPETYQALDWARAYKDFLTDVATLMRAYSRFAGKLTTKGGPKGVAAAKTKLGTTLGANNGSEANPPPATGSIFIGSDQVDYTPFNLRGASISPEDGRRLLLMVAAATGLPEFFFGDANVGNHATAKTLDRPTELKFKDRQTFWADTFDAILQYVIDRAALASNGPIKGTLGAADEDGERMLVLETDPETGEPLDRQIDIAFPAILEHSVTENVAAIVQAATLDGKAPALFDTRMITRMLLTALGQDNIDEMLDELFPPDVAPPDQRVAAESAMVEAARELRDALVKLREGRS
jgi:hypothetical protein